MIQKKMLGYNHNFFSFFVYYTAMSYANLKLDNYTFVDYF